MATGGPLQAILDRLQSIETLGQGLIATVQAQGDRITALELLVTQLGGEVAALKAKSVGWAPPYRFPQPPL